MFTLSPTADTTGITTTGELAVPPALIVERFGTPGPGDGDKVSGEFVFIDHNGQPFVVHDWKSTSLWEQELQSPEQFWSSGEPQEFCVASCDLDTAAFEAWFTAQLK